MNVAVTLETNPVAPLPSDSHRDDKVHHVVHPDQSKTGSQVGSDLSMAFLIPGTEIHLREWRNTSNPQITLTGL